MNGFSRYSCILDLFSEQKNSWAISDMSKVLNTPSSTVYRIVRELVNTGFLESAKSAYYRLGPAFVKYNRTLSQTDPFIQSGILYLNTLTAQIAIPNTAILARLYDNKVMCVADSHSINFKHHTSFQRGQPMPLAKGATSLIILSNIQENKLNRLFKTTQLKTLNNKEDFKRMLKKIRLERQCITQGEVDKGLTGCAVPVNNKTFGIVGSLSVIFSDEYFSAKYQSEIFSHLNMFAKHIENHMQIASEEITNENDE